MSNNQWDTYADLLDERIGTGGDDLHTKLIDPLIVSYAGDTSGKTVVDLGCGNGYLFGKLSPRARFIGVDGSDLLLEKAKERTKKLESTQFISSDISKPLPLDDHIADIVIANMVLQYVPDLAGVCQNITRILKKDGLCIMIIDHPGHLLFLRAQEVAGKSNNKFLDSTSYFIEGERRKKSLWDKAILTFYHRTVTSYINAFAKQFHLDQMDEVSEDGEMPRVLGLKWKKI